MVFSISFRMRQAKDTGGTRARLTGCSAQVELNWGSGRVLRASVSGNLWLENFWGLRPRPSRTLGVPLDRNEIVPPQGLRHLDRGTRFHGVNLGHPIGVGASQWNAKRCERILIGGVHHGSSSAKCIRRSESR